MIDKQYMVKFIMENSISDTPNITMMQLRALDESSLTRISDAIAEKIYSIAVKKYKDLDFGTLEASKGDITKYSQYKMLKDIIQLLTELCGNNTPVGHPVEVLSKALDNMVANSDLFTRAFKDGVGLGKMIYNLTAKAIIEYAGLLVSTSIDLARTPDGTYKTVYMSREIKDKNMKLLLESLNGFNKSVANGDLIKVVGQIDANKAAVQHNLNTAAFQKYGAITAAVISAYWISVGLIVGLRYLVYVFYATRQKYANMFEQYAIMLELNMKTVKDDKVLDKQKKLADRFRKLSDIIAIQNKKVIAEDAMEKDEKIDIVKAGEGVLV